MALKLVGIAGSLRKYSYNDAALRALVPLLPEDMSLETVSLVDIPFYNNDVEQVGFPQPVQQLRGKFAAADAIVIASPEYNFSVSGMLKNALEWLSRPPNAPVNAKPCAILGASVSPLGTARGRFHLRHICVSLNMIPVNVPHVDINNAKAKFDSDNRLTDQPSLDLMRQLMMELRSLTIRLKSGVN